MIMKFTFRMITNILSVLAIIAFTGIIVTVCMQILSRFLPFSYVWTEELTRYFFLFAISCGAPLALLKNEYINVDLIIGRLSDKVRRVYEIIIYTIILVFSIIMSKESYFFMILGHKQKFSTIPFKNLFFYFSILIFLFFFSFFFLF